MRLYIIIPFLFLTISSLGQKIYVDSSVYENGQIENKGLYYQIGNQSWQWGIWEYWYEDGRKKLELWNDTVKTRYINMWLPDSRQILKSGNGFYYFIERDAEFDDSLVCEIQDSIKNGIVRRFRSYTSHPYFLIETGFYKNEKKTGIWHFRDTVYKSSLLKTFAGGKQNGLEIHFFLNGQVKDSVSYLDDKENGNYRAYSQKDILLKDCNYKDGRLIDYFKEYYPNGKLKVQGQYTQGNGYIKINIVSIGRKKNNVRTETRFIKNKSLKQGIWKYFNDQGKLIRVEKFVNDIKM